MPNVRKQGNRRSRYDGSFCCRIDVDLLATIVSLMPVVFLNARARLSSSLHRRAETLESWAASS